jgi:hypothetical protein
VHTKFYGRDQSRIEVPFHWLYTDQDGAVLSLSLTHTHTQTDQMIIVSHSLLFSRVVATCYFDFVARYENPILKERPFESCRQYFELSLMNLRLES